MLAVLPFAPPRPFNPPRFRARLRTLLLGLLLVATPFAAPAATRIERITFQGWTDALRLDNGQVEAVIVPQVGRVMSFRLAGGENVFWTDRSLDGQTGDVDGTRWVNFGGDKSWPAPEAEWRQFTGRSRWMPPPAFDALPVAAEVVQDRVVLTSSVDPFYGIRIVRTVSLRPDAPIMEIETVYRREFGEPAPVAIWVITQLTEPEAIYVPIIPRSRFRDGHFVFGEKPWSQVSVSEPFLRITRDPAVAHKLGSDADRMLWVGRSVVCLITSPRIAEAEYPDRGASSEVYTNPDPKAYVELETLGPLQTLARGETMRQVNTYLLRHRTDPPTALLSESLPAR